jgi:hypothetical protein
MLGFDGELLLLWKLHKTYFQNMGISYNQQILEIIQPTNIGISMNIIQATHIGISYNQ